LSGLLRILAYPERFRTDNGSPFASANSLFGLTRLSVWWLRLGIDLERIKPGHPQRNGRHERMHLTLKKEATKPAAKSFLQQQGRFDQFIRVFNEERPHQGLNMRLPAEIYSGSPRLYSGLPELEYPFHDRTVTVTRCGRICIGPMKINLSQAFAGQKVGVNQVEEKIWLVSFMRYDLGTRHVASRARRTPSLRECYPCLRYKSCRLRYSERFQ
jgi:putative transposase